MVSEIQSFTLKVFRIMGVNRALYFSARAATPFKRCSSVVYSA